MIVQLIRGIFSISLYSLFASESCLQIFDKIAHGSIAICNQIAFWWCIFQQNNSKKVRYTPRSFTTNYPIDDSFFDMNVLNIYLQEFDLLFNHAFGEFPSSTMKFYCRYQSGLITYHSICYKRKNKRSSYNICIKEETSSGKVLFSYGQILFFFCRNQKHYILFKRYVRSRMKVSSLIKPIEDVPNWKMYMERYFSLVHHCSAELLIIPCSSIVSKCFFFSLNDDLSICTRIELETEHD